MRRPLTGGLVVIHIDPLQLEIAVAVVSAGGIYAMLIADHLPKLRTQNSHFISPTQQRNDPGSSRLKGEAALWSPWQPATSGWAAQYTEVTKLFGEIKAL